MAYQSIASLHAFPLPTAGSDYKSPCLFRSHRSAACLTCASLMQRNACISLCLLGYGCSERLILCSLAKRLRSHNLCEVFSSLHPDRHSYKALKHVTYNVLVFDGARNYKERWPFSRSCHSCNHALVAFLPIFLRVGAGGLGRRDTSALVSRTIFSPAVSRRT